MEQCRPAPEVLENLRAAVASMQDEESESLGPPHAVRVNKARVLFVGGDERQAKITPEIKTELEGQHPGLHVRFEHTGWSGNWGDRLSRIQGISESYDAIVIMRFIRTEFGRRLRASLQVPWTHCNHGGRETIKRSILRAASWGQVG